jgi:hypothetical protein
LAAVTGSTPGGLREAAPFGELILDHPIIAGGVWAHSSLSDSACAEITIEVAAHQTRLVQIRLAVAGFGFVEQNPLLSSVSVTAPAMGTTAKSVEPPKPAWRNRR